MKHRKLLNAWRRLEQLLESEAELECSGSVKPGEREAGMSSNLFFSILKVILGQDGA